MLRFLRLCLLEEIPVIQLVSQFRLYVVRRRFGILNEVLLVLALRLNRWCLGSLLSASPGSYVNTAEKSTKDGNGKLRLSVSEFRSSVTIAGERRARGAEIEKSFRCYLAQGKCATYVVRADLAAEEIVFDNHCDERLELVSVECAESRQ